MGHTFVEKILNATTGSLVYREPDIVLCHDNSARIQGLFKKAGGKNIQNPDKLFVVLDRKQTGQVEELIRDYNAIRDFMHEQKVERFFDCDSGICHEVLASHLRPGMTITGSDSHTCTAGAFNCFAVGLNKTETARLWKTGKIWFRVPETVKITLKGRLRSGVYAKDIALWVMGMLREEFVEYKAIEYHGEGVRQLSIADRMCIANVSEEMGVKNSVFPPDDTLADYFGDVAVRGVWADEDAVYYKEFTVDLNEVMPLVLFTHQHNEVKSVDECKELEIQQGLIGACSNGRMDDLRIVAHVLKNKRIHPGFQLFVVPASREIYLQAREEGLIDTIIKSGASVLGASCGPCLGSSHMINADAKRFISTTNSHSMRRLSDMGVEKYVASPATVAMTALTGKLTAEMDYKGEKYRYWNLPVTQPEVSPFEKRKFSNVWNYSDKNYISCKQLFPEELTHKISLEDGAAILPHILEEFDPEFARHVSKGDIIIAGESFGVGRL
ncbi:aconitate hydratase, partial [Porphyromonadaceae bacterium OttesenSCG-928-L07]|nr:aconitate hydratase [Porphyromonadaceae bacterium OttesenSCG-928-L07]